MNSSSSNAVKIFEKPLYLLVPVVLAGVFLFGFLSQFGLWEPMETVRAQAGMSSLEGETAGESAAHVDLGASLAGLGWKLGGKGELFARLPMAVLALASLLVVLLVVRSLAGKTVAYFAAIALAASPVFLFHGRQVTGAASFMAGEIFAMGGLLLLLRGEKRASAVLGFFLAAAGMILATRDGGLLVGVVLPAGTAFLTLALSGRLGLFFSPEGLPKRELVTGACCLLGTLFASIAYIYVSTSEDLSVSLVTGVVSERTVRPESFTFGLDRLVYGWFPWSAAAPLALFGMLYSNKRDSASRYLAAFSVAGVALGLVVFAFHRASVGDAPVFLVFPMVLAVGLGFEKLEKSEGPSFLAAATGVILLVILLRDFAQEPKAILGGFGVSDLKIPKDFAPVKPAIIAAVPFGLTVLAAGFLGRGEGEKASTFRKMRVRILVPMAAVALAGYTCLFMIPELSLSLSSKHVLAAYEKYADDGDPLAYLGTGRPPTKAEKLKGQADALDWLSKQERVFALLSPKHLAPLNRQYREKHGEHIFILDDSSKRHLLATNRPPEGQKNRNPIVQYVFSSLAQKPRHAMNVNFNDKITLLGWEVKSETGSYSFKKGKDFTLTTYWRCDEVLPANYEIFVHIDGPGPRIHGDHEPVAGTYPTKEWRPGDYIVDVHSGSVPSYQEAGMYRLKAGMYKGAKRLKVMGEKSSKDNSVYLGKVSVD